LLRLRCRKCAIGSSASSSAGGVVLRARLPGSCALPVCACCAGATDDANMLVVVVVVGERSVVSSCCGVVDPRFAFAFTRDESDDISASLVSIIVRLKSVCFARRQTLK
jgi:hypothetical protein